MSLISRLFKRKKVKVVRVLNRKLLKEGDVIWWRLYKEGPLYCRQKVTKVTPFVITVDNYHVADDDPYFKVYQVERDGKIIFPVEEG